MSNSGKITLINAAAVRDAGSVGKRRHRRVGGDSGGASREASGGASGVGSAGGSGGGSGGGNVGGGQIAVRDGAILAAGSVDEVTRQLRHLPPPARTIDLPDQLLVPAMVNAHAHLDLTLVGPQPFEGDFTAWLQHVTAARPAHDDVAAVAQAVSEGVAQSRAAGVIYLGDIAASPAAVRARFDCGLPGVSFIECFGPGRWQGEYLERLKQQLAQLPHEASSDSHDPSTHGGGMLGGIGLGGIIPGGMAGRRGPVLGIAPHAPYTTGDDIYAFVARYGRDHALRLTTHLAESLDEEQFTRHATGLFVEHLKHYDRFDESITASGLHPIDHVAKHLRVTPWLLAHCNYVEDEHLTLLAKCRASVAYCPIASDYFGHGQRTPHRYRDMLGAGVNVCLGSDSILCQQPNEAQPMSMLAPMRYLYQRDKTDPGMLLRMATINGMIGLGLEPNDATFTPGAPATINSITIDPNNSTDALEQALTNDAPIVPVEIPIAS